MRGRRLLCEKPLPRAPSRRAAVGDDWGRGRFSKRSASPPDPLSRRVAGNRLVCSFGGSRPCCVGAVSCCLCVVTAADRAAATCLRWGRKALFTQTAMTGLSRHGRLCQTSKGFSPQRDLSCAVTRMTEDAPPRRMSAAALSAAVDSSPSPESLSPFRRNQASRINSPERQPLFGSRGSGGRGASL